MERIVNEPEPDKPKGRRICSVCKKDLGPADMEDDTHTYCEECLAKALREIPEAIGPDGEGRES